MRQRRALRLLALAVAAACLPAICTPARGAPEKLVPAVFRSLTDKQGLQYNADPQGRVRAPYGWLLAGLNVNNSGLSTTSRQMTPDGHEFVLTSRNGGLQLTLRIKVDAALGGVRIVQVLHNPGGQSVQAGITLYSQLNYPFQQLVTDTGRKLGSGPLQKGESAVVGTLRGANNVHVIYLLASPRSPLRPVIANQNNHQLQFGYTLQVPAKGTVALVQRALILPRGGVPAGRALKSLLAGLRGRQALADLPRDLRRTLANLRRRGSEEDARLRSVEQLTDVAPAGDDQLAFGAGTLLRGTATCRRLGVRGAHGSVDVPFARVAALVGARCATLSPQVRLRDGQKLVGEIVTEGLRFEMSSGMGVDLDVARLDRLVLHAVPPASADAGDAEGSDASFLVETFDGERIKARKKTPALAVATAWGALQVPLDDLRHLGLAGPEDPGYVVALGDGSRFHAFLRDAPLEVESELFGTVRLSPHGIRRLLRPSETAHAEAEDPQEMAQPHLLLVGGDVLAGRIEADALHFLGAGGALPQPPDQLRHLRNLDEDAARGDAALPRFHAELWGGGYVTGELREVLLPVRTACGRLTIPAREVLEAHVPTPVVPAALVPRLEQLVRDLGNASWARRETASKELARLGELARAALEKALRESQDPEVKRRARRLLDRL